MSTRLVGALIALLATLALAAGCGGGDSSEAASTATAETVTVTTAAPVTDPVDTTASQEPADESSDTNIDIEDMEAVISMYKTSLGLSDGEARCVLDKAMKLGEAGDFSGPNPDISALMGSGIMSVFTDCGVDFGTLMERMSQAG